MDMPNDAFAKTVLAKFPTRWRRRITLALRDIPERDYFIAVLRYAPSAMRSVLLAILRDAPDPDFGKPGLPTEIRAQAAHWLLYGYREGYWTATKHEKTLARSLEKKIGASHVSP